MPRSHWRRLDAITCEHIDQRVLDTAHEAADADPESSDVEHEVPDQLARPMVGDLPTSVGLYHRNLAWRQKVLGLACLALGEYRSMLGQPDFVAGIGSTRLGEGAHGGEDLRVVSEAEVTDPDRRGLAARWRVAVRRRKLEGRCG